MGKSNEKTAENYIDLTFEQRKDIGLKYVLDMLDPACPYGAKLLKTLRIYKSEEKDELEREQGNVSAMLFALEQSYEKVSAIRHTLSALKDISGSIKNCAQGTLTEVELFEITAFLFRIKELIPQAEALPGYGEMTGAHFEHVDAPLAILDPKSTGRLSFFIEDTRTPELQRLRQIKRELDEKLSHRGAETDKLMAQRIATVSAEQQELLTIYSAISDSLRPMLPILEKNISAAGRLDAAICKAVLARRYAGTKPELGGQELMLERAVNPEVSDHLAETGRQFTPITVKLPTGATILTGANMGGKSVAIKTMTLNVALALMGFFVFCDKSKIPLFDGIELINRDFSSITSGLSSFGGEITRFNETVKRLREGRLLFIAMDEFARGTNSEEGAAIIRAVVKYLSGRNAVSILATHYDGAAEYASRRYQVCGISKALNAAKLQNNTKQGVAFIAEHMHYGLIEVDKNEEQPREAILICRLLGMDEEILNEIECNR